MEKKNNKNNARRDGAFRGYNRRETVSQPAVLPENLVIGRNAVRELLATERDVEKAYVQRGEREGSINMLIGMIQERKIPIIELDKAKLDSMCNNARHQGIALICSEEKYSSVE